MGTPAGRASTVCQLLIWNAWTDANRQFLHNKIFKKMKISDSFQFQALKQVITKRNCNYVAT